MLSIESEPVEKNEVLAVCVKKSNKQKLKKLHKKMVNTQNTYNAGALISVAIIVGLGILKLMSIGDDYPYINGILMGCAMASFIAFVNGSENFHVKKMKKIIDKLPD